MKRKLLLALTASVCALSCAFGLAACGGDTHDGSGGNETVAVESITLNQTTLTLDIDGTETLTVTYTPTGATTKTVTWSSSAPTIASVDETGKVTAKAEGTATITATTSNQKTASCTVTVNAPAPDYEVNAEQWQTALGKSAFTNFTLTMYNSDTEEGEEWTIKADYPNGVWYIKEGNSYESYYTHEGDNYYEYYSQDGTDFTRYEADKDEFENYLFDPEIFSFMEFADYYTQFTYNGTSNKYTASGIDLQGEGDLYGAEFKFLNGKLVYADLDVRGEWNSYYEFVHGQTSLKIPEKYAVSSEDIPSAKPVNGQITEEQWKEMLSKPAFTNFTAHMESEYYKNEDFAMSDGILYVHNQDAHYFYYSHEGDDYYKYESTSGNSWTRTQISESDYNTAIGEACTWKFSTVKDKFSSFAYNAEQEAYVSTEEISIYGNARNVIVKFSEGKLVYFAMLAKTSSYNMIYTITHGETSLTLPV